ncbi:MAG: ABC transporter ATP-binding protein [Acidobacteria bacterium]|nr:ABC transporter ATP-binding protein [Acidobacteriota bacterium]
MQPVISVRGLRKAYGTFEAVRGIEFEVREGEVFGLLGPNGAGKTSTVEILEGLRPRSAGEVTVLGYDPGVDVRALKDRIGVCLQATNLPEKIKVSEALALFAAFYSRNTDQNKLIDRLQLGDKKDAFYSTLSGGQKQRVAIALALVNSPKLAFFDEPTTGLDPQVRLEIHGLISELRASKTTTLLTTHYIEEAERLCDRVAIMDEGRIIAMGTPREIQQSTLGHTMIEISTERPLPDGALPELMGASEMVVTGDRKELRMASAEPARAIVELVKWIDQAGVGLADIHMKRPTLEDAFIKLTGKSLRD